MAAQSFDEFSQAIRQILLHDWDPHNASRNPSAEGEYDTYIAPLSAMLRAGATEEQLVTYLHEREQETMCFPSLGTQRLKRVAWKLLEAGAKQSRKTE